MSHDTQKMRYSVYIDLLRQLIRTPSFSREENATADIIFDFFKHKNLSPHRKGNNVWAVKKAAVKNAPLVLLNSHHDTVKPAAGWLRDPFSPDIEGDILYGLGSNDAGGALVALIAAFCHFEEGQLPFDMMITATAEEEISGANGIASLLPDLPTPSVGIVGEPTQMQMAVAEKGLMVIDATAHGKAGHAARDEGINALYIASDDIQRLRQFQFEKISPLLGAVKATVTQIEAGTQHNVVPDTCQFVIDIRTNEFYTNQAVFEILQNQLTSTLKARSFRLNSSKIDLSHPLVQCGLGLGLSYFGSPTLSDQALMSFPTLKIGPGDSARSHTADEFIKISEIRKGIDIYIQLLTKLNI